MNISVKTKTAFGAALLVISVLAAFSVLGGYSFIDFDDDVYVTDNRRVQAGLTTGNAVWAFTTLDAGLWHPLTWLSRMLDHDLYGGGAGGFPWTNILFHAFSATLLFLAMNRMTGALWRSLFVAALCIPSFARRARCLDRGMQRNLKNAMDMCRDKDHK